jgi:hypothetical protein
MSHRYRAGVLSATVAAAFVPASSGSITTAEGYLAEADPKRSVAGLVVGLRESIPNRWRELDSASLSFPHVVEGSA